MAVVDAAGAVLAANPALERLAGPDVSMLVAGVPDFLLGGEEHYEEQRPHAYGGRELCVRVRAAAARDGEAPVAVVTFDEAPAEVATQDDRFRRLVEHSSDMITVLSAAGRIVYESPPCERILGWRPEEMVGVDVLAFVHPDDVPKTAAAFERILAGDALVTLELRFMHKDGSWVPLQSNGRNMLADPAIQGVVVNCHDISDRVAAASLEAQLRESQKLEAIGQLAGGIAHDFNNLLTVIAGFCARARERAGDAAAGDLDQIQLAAERAASLTRQLLAFGRRQTLQPRSIDLSAVAAELETLLRRLLGEHIAIETRLVADARVYADAAQLTQVLVNLAVNARDAMPRGGTLTIETRAVGDTVRLVVGDTGQGMDAETRARIFEPFFTTKAPGAGTGLGLSTVYGIVEQSGGSIAVESSPGGGTAFTLTFPASAEPLEEPCVGEEPAAAGAARATAAILLVEDDEVVRAIVDQILTARGYEVVAAATPRAALELAAAGTPFDLVLTDVVMPEMSGRQLVAQLAQSRAALNVVYTSGYASDELDPDDLQRAVFLQKPFTADVLTATVAQALARR